MTECPRSSVTAPRLVRLFTISFGSPASRPVNKSWRGGRRVMKVAGKKRGSPSETTLYKTHQQTKSTPKRRAERANSTSRNEDICGMGSRLSKRKRTNMFDSLDPRVMEATTKARYVLVYVLLCFLCLMIASCLRKSPSVDRTSSTCQQSLQRKGIVRKKVPRGLS